LTATNNNHERLDALLPTKDSAVLAFLQNVTEKKGTIWWIADVNTPQKPNIKTIAQTFFNFLMDYLN